MTTAISAFSDTSKNHPTLHQGEFNVLLRFISPVHRKRQQRR